MQHFPFPACRGKGHLTMDPKTDETKGYMTLGHSNWIICKMNFQGLIYYKGLNVAATGAGGWAAAPPWTPSYQHTGVAAFHHAGPASYTGSSSYQHTGQGSYQVPTPLPVSTSYSSTTTTTTITTTSTTTSVAITQPGTRSTTHQGTQDTRKTNLKSSPQTNSKQNNSKPTSHQRPRSNSPKSSKPR